MYSSGEIWDNSGINISGPVEANYPAPSEYNFQTYKFKSKVEVPVLIKEKPEGVF